MDSTSNQTAAGDLSGQLALSPISTDGGGPINFLANEIMALFFDKLKLKTLGGYNDDNSDDNEDDEDENEDEDAHDGDNEDDDDDAKDEDDDDEDSEDNESNNYADKDGGHYYYDANMLAKLRLVSKKWNLLVEDFCRQKKSLNVNASFSNPAFKKSVPLVVKLKTIDFFGTMLKLFPNVVQLAVGFCSELDDTQIRDFAVQIDSLSSLKLLKLEGEILAALPALSQTLSKLEHFEVDGQSRYCFQDDWLEFVSDLGPDCSVGLYLGDSFKVVYDDILQCHNKNPHFYANLTHLQMHFYGESIGDPEVCAKVVHFLSEHATFLEFLAIYVVESYLEMSPSVIRDLAKLVYLTKLKLWSIVIDIPELETVQDGLTSLPAVLACEFYVVWDKSADNADKFTRVLSTIFPNLVDLHLDFNMEFSFSWRFIRKIEQNLNRFPNLRKHKVDYSNIIFEL